MNWLDIHANLASRRWFVAHRITILMNWLGGLQVWSESSRRAELLNHEPDVPGEWLWVKPKKGCASKCHQAVIRFSFLLL